MVWIDLGEIYDEYSVLLLNFLFRVVFVCMYNIINIVELYLYILGY